MKNIRAEMFNRKASDPKNKPDEILEALELQQGQRVADIGGVAVIFLCGLLKLLEKMDECLPLIQIRNF